MSKADPHPFVIILHPFPIALYLPIPTLGEFTAPSIVPLIKDSRLT